MTGVGGSKWYFGIFRFWPNPPDIQLVTLRRTGAGKHAAATTIPYSLAQQRVGLYLTYCPQRTVRLQLQLDSPTYEQFP